ncbi:hypothetical protein CDAR_525381 [Caerostris darwini]|uniref:Ycf15 n=1 Tax=Caerostris darwini TaxID=1538125 RepID=A0AAV4RIN7_9ARAC|nr:hypothetical protein CDAR_525381 [Caerostris darwini]
MFTFVEEEKEKNISARRMNRNPFIPHPRVTSHTIWEGSLLSHHPFSQRSRSSFFPHSSCGKRAVVVDSTFIYFYSTPDGERRKDLLAEHFSRLSCRPD